MIRVELPAICERWQTVDGEMKIDLESEATRGSVLDALEACNPTLRGTIRARCPASRFACLEGGAPPSS